MIILHNCQNIVSTISHFIFPFWFSFPHPRQSFFTQFSYKTIQQYFPCDFNRTPPASDMLRVWNTLIPMSQAPISTLSSMSSYTKNTPLQHPVVEGVTPLTPPSISVRVISADLMLEFISKLFCHNFNYGVDTKSAAQHRS